MWNCTEQFGGGEMLRFDEYTYIDPENSMCRRMRRPNIFFIIADMSRAQAERAAPGSGDKASDVFSNVVVRR